MHPFWVLTVNVRSCLTTVAPRGSGRAFALGQILNPYATHYRQPFAFSTILYPLIHQVALRLPCPCTEVRGRAIGLTTFPELPTRDGGRAPIHLGFVFPGAA